VTTYDTSSGWFVSLLCQIAQQLCGCVACLSHFLSFHDADDDDDHNAVGDADDDKSPSPDKNSK
jgi:hypothetical protein